MRPRLGHVRTVAPTLAEYVESMNRKLEDRKHEQAHVRQRVCAKVIWDRLARLGVVGASTITTSDPRGD